MPSGLCMHGMVVTALVSAGAPAQDPLSEQLRRLVAIADPAERVKAADEFAAATDATVPELRAAMQRFGTVSPREPGRSVERVPLFNGEALEPTELHVYVPKSMAQGSPAPLLLIGHGTGGSGAGMLGGWVGFAERTGTVLLAPSEPGPNEGWAFTVRERELHRAAIRWARQCFDIDENRILCTGISRGGHMAWDLALRYPDLFAAIAPMIGGPRINVSQGQNNLRYIENVCHLPIRDLQGSKDDPYLVANLRYAFARLSDLKAADARLIEFPELGHSFDMSAVDWVEFFGKSVRDPRPRRVVRMMATRRETRAFWIDVMEKDKSKAPLEPRIPATAKVDAMDMMQKREFVARQVERKTARLEVEMLAKGDFNARAEHVRSFRILLDPEMFEADGPVYVKFKGRRRRVTVNPSKAVLCRDFAERFDRTFLPVAEVVVR